uniref:Uncharacterized protein n=1 Tax=Angiostrongylus cantonensis TaxID=6313 RepID=A0A0K0DFT9_ANGCA
MCCLRIANGGNGGRWSQCAEPQLHNDYIIVVQSALQLLGGQPCDGRRDHCHAKAAFSVVSDAPSLRQ